MCVQHWDTLKHRNKSTQQRRCAVPKRQESDEVLLVNCQSDSSHKMEGGINAYKSCFFFEVLKTCPAVASGFD